MSLSIAGKKEEGASHTRTFLHGSMFSAGGMAASGILTMLTGIVFARWLKPEGFGIYSLVLVVVSFMGGLGAFGMENTAARYVCYYLGTGERPLIRTIIRYALWWALVVSSFLGLALFVLLRIGLLNHTKLAQLAPLAVYVALVVPAFAVQQVLLQTILGLESVKTRVVLEKVLQPLLRLLLPFALLLFFTDRITAAVAGVLATACLLAGISALFLRVHMRGLPRSIPATPAVKKEWSGYALPYVFFSLQTFVSSGMGIDILLVGALASVTDSGIYAATFRFLLVLLIARASMEFSFGPKVGRLYGESDLDSIGSLYKTSSRLGLAWTLPFAIVMVTFSQPLMSEFFGPAFGRGGAALAVLALGFAVDGAAGCNVTLLSMIGKPWLVLINGLTSGVLTVGLCFLLIPRFGMLGAAFGVSAARCTATGLGTFEIWRIFKIHPFSRSVPKLLIASLVSGLLGYACIRQQVLPIGHSYFVLAAAIGLVLLSFIITLRAVRFSIAAR